MGKPNADLPHGGASSETPPPAVVETPKPTRAVALEASPEARPEPGAGSVAAHGGGTVSGVPLEQGERVVLYAQPTHKTAKLVHIIVGVILAPVLIGIPLIIYGVLYERWHLRFVALTSLRVMAKTGDKPVRFLYLKDIVDVRAKRQETAGGGAIGAVAAAAMNQLASGAPKETEAYWRNTQAIVVQGKKGAISIEASAGPEWIGPALVRAVWTDGYVEGLPTAAHPA